MRGNRRRLARNLDVASGARRRCCPKRQGNEHIALGDGVSASELYMLSLLRLNHLYIVGRDARRYKLCDVPFLDQQKHPNYTNSAHYKVENYTLLL